MCKAFIPPPENDVFKCAQVFIYSSETSSDNFVYFYQFREQTMVTIDSGGTLCSSNVKRMQTKYTVQSRRVCEVKEIQSSIDDLYS